jgi:glycosyltransferase involved in cell wall biosynthesis
LKLQLLINATILNDPRMSGLGVYTHNLLSELLPLLCVDNLIGSITLMGDCDRIANLFGDTITHERISVDHMATKRPLIRLIELNRRVYARHADRDVLFYSPTHHGVVVKGVPQVITIHDLFARIFPDNYRMQSYYFKYYLPHVLSSTRVVINDSRSTADDLRRYYEHTPATSVVYAAMRKDLNSEPPRSIPRLVGKSFFLFVGPSFTYKNADRLIDAFASLRGQHEERRDLLVFTGGRESYVVKLKKHIDSTCPHFQSDILFLGYVSKEELAWLYQHAVAAMVTTLYEGFGLPALEAMHFGCPVVASKVASLPEVCADAVVYVSPYDVHDISVAMFRVAADHALRATLIEKGHSNVKRFSWNNAAERVLQVLKRAACERA